jgi:CBS domain-containing protein
MTCEEIMKKNATRVEPTDTVKLAASKMRAQNLGFLPVCEKDGKVVGTLTDRDIAIRLVAEGKDGAATTVNEIMTREPVGCSAADDIETAAELMAKHQKSRIVCFDEEGKKLLGVISLSDLAQAADRQRVADTMRRVTERESQIGH